MSNAKATSWYGVRCVFRFPDSGTEPIEPDVYEERVTVWQARSFDEAIKKAEREAAEYVTDLDGGIARRG